MVGRFCIRADLTRLSAAYEFCELCQVLAVSCGSKTKRAAGSKTLSTLSLASRRWRRAYHKSRRGRVRESGGAGGGGAVPAGATSSARKRHGRRRTRAGARGTIDVRDLRKRFYTPEPVDAVGGIGFEGRRGGPERGVQPNDAVQDHRAAHAEVTLLSSEGQPPNGHDWSAYATKVRASIGDLDVHGGFLRRHTAREMIRERRPGRGCGKKGGELRSSPSRSAVRARTDGVPRGRAWPRRSTSPGPSSTARPS